MSNDRQAWILGVCLLAGLLGLGMFLGNSLIEFRQLERTVTVKGLAEREMPADIVIWPIQFARANDDSTKLYADLQRDADAVVAFLKLNGISDKEISFSPPSVIDKLAQQYNDGGKGFRYTGHQTITVYSSNVAVVRNAVVQLAELGKQGITFSGDQYNNQTEYLFNGLNTIKPEMIEAATRQAREVAEKFASDSQSKLGKIKSASQGQFTITDRDKNNPHIKTVRIVSTVEYYLVD
jgi:hypothetical protein